MIILVKKYLISSNNWYSKNRLLSVSLLLNILLGISFFLSLGYFGPLDPALGLGTEAELVLELLSEEERITSYINSSLDRLGDINKRHLELMKLETLLIVIIACLTLYNKVQ
jgi:hypothetical protein